MALQSSGAISLSDIQTEFGGTNPISMSEYYRGGSFVTDNNTGVPTSGEIDLADFYGATNQFSYTFSSNTQEVDLNSTLTTAGWNGSDPVVVTINSGIYIWSDSTSTAALTISSALNGLLTLTNNGYIIGKGGKGGDNTAAGNGGDAISNAATGVTLTNASGAYIAGGGGGGDGGAVTGGGGGAGGGVGGTNESGVAGGTGGALGQAGGDGPDSSVTGTNGDGGYGGGAGGGGGTYDASGPGVYGGGGGGGGRILPGVGGSGGNTSPYGYKGGDGGSAGNAGSSGAASGGGGWGAAGGGSNGGSGGAAISGTAIATYTNNGTVYGSVA